MSVELPAEVSPVERADARAPLERARSGSSLLSSLLKNLLMLGLVAGGVVAYETGYFSNDRISRGDWSALYAFPKEHVGRSVYEAAFVPDLMKRRDDTHGNWDLYNGARAETVAVEGGTLAMKYSLAWLGVHFNHTSFEPKALYRVRMELKVDGEPAAILMRNRQLDYMRMQLPTTNGEFKEFTADYAAPAGRWDQVKLIFMPDGRDKVSGALTIRKFRIERLEK